MGDRSTAVGFFNQGIEALQQPDPEGKLKAHAYQLFSSACMADPSWWNGFYQAGNNDSDLQLHRAAIACWRRALECEPSPADRAKVLTNLGWRLHTVGLTDEAEQVSLEAVRLDPTLSGAHLNLSLINGILNLSRHSVAYAREAHRLRTDCETEFALAFALLYDRQLEEGFVRFESRFAYRLHEYLQFPYPKWLGEPDRIVYLVADQGLGDTLSFARFVERACERSKYVHARVQPELLRLFSHAFAHVPNLNLIPMPYPFPQADCWTTFVSLPFALKLSDEEIRSALQIAAPVCSLPSGWIVPDRKLHVGIAWAGSPLNEIDRHRNVPFEQFLELYRVPGVQLYSLQVGDRARDMHDAGAAAVVRDIVPYVRDVVDTVALLQWLDLVICCESALGHIAALAGKECWLPYSWLGRDWRVGLDGSDQLWSRHRVFRQGPDMRWEPVFAEIVEALKERVHDQDRRVQGSSGDQRADGVAAE